MPKQSIAINCPKCGTEINVSEILYQQVEEERQKDFEARNVRRQLDFDKRVKELEEDTMVLPEQIGECNA